MIFLMALVAQTMDLDSLRSEFKPIRRDAKIVDDAISRWRLRSGNRGDPMRGRFVIVFDTLHERCVTLRLRATDLGGSPVYCYGRDNDQIISVYDDFE